MSITMLCVLTGVGQPRFTTSTSWKSREVVPVSLVNLVSERDVLGQWSQILPVHLHSFVTTIFHPVTSQPVLPPDVLYVPCHFTQKWGVAWWSGLAAATLVTTSSYILKTFQQFIYFKIKLCIRSKNSCSAVSWSVLLCTWKSGSWKPGLLPPSPPPIIAVTVGGLTVYGNLRNLSLIYTIWWTIELS